MRAICPTCDTAYTIPDERIGAQGRKVRCVKCGEQWRVMPAIEEAAAPGFEAVPAEPTAAVPPAPPIARPAAVMADATPIDEDHWASVAQHFEGGNAEEAGETATSDDRLDDEGIAPKSEAPPEAPTAAASARRLPRLPDIRLRLKPKLPRPKISLPRLPIAVTRATPFFGPLVFVTALLVVAGLVGFRTKIVAAAPGLAGFYAMVGMEVNLRGLTFGPIETLREIDNGQPVLVVEGTLANPTKQERGVPALRFALRDADTQELYAWSIDPKATVIAAGDSLRYRTRLVAPPDRAADLQVRFVERRNHQAGLK